MPLKIFCLGNSEKFSSGATRVHLSQLSVYSDVQSGMILDNLASFPFCGDFLKTRTEGALSMHNSFTLNTQSYYLINQGTNLSSESQMSA